MSDLREIWDGGGTAIGAWVLLRDPLIAEAAARAGFDYVVVDLQHGLNSFDSLEGMVQAIVLGGSTPLVRVPWHDHWMIGRALDAGAQGVIVPMVNDAEQARRVADACRYAPVGTRSIGPIAVGTRVPDYSSTANDRVLCIVMIETAEALANIDEITSVPGVDATYIGPSDLSLSLGLVPGADNPDPKFQDALVRIAQSSVAHGVVAGVHTDAEYAAARHATGFRMITTGYDFSPMRAAMAAQLAQGRAAGS